MNKKFKQWIACLLAVTMLSLCGPAMADSGARQEPSRKEAAQEQVLPERSVEMEALQSSGEGPAAEETDQDLKKPEQPGEEEEGKPSQEPEQPGGEEGIIPSQEPEQPSEEEGPVDEEADQDLEEPEQPGEEQTADPQEPEATPMELAGEEMMDLAAYDTDEELDSVIYNFQDTTEITNLSDEEFYGKYNQQTGEWEMY